VGFSIATTSRRHTRLQVGSDVHETAKHK
jgi:hypothetical protein